MKFAFVNFIEWNDLIDTLSFYLLIWFLIRITLQAKTINKNNSFGQTKSENDIE